MKRYVKDLFDDLKEVPLKTHAGICSFSFLVGLSAYLFAQQIFLLPTITGFMMSSLYVFTFNRIEYQNDEIEWLQILSSKKHWDETMQSLLSDGKLHIMSDDKDITERYLASRFEEERQKNIAKLAQLTAGEK